MRKAVMALVIATLLPTGPVARAGDAEAGCFLAYAPDRRAVPTADLYITNNSSDPVNVAVVNFDLLAAGYAPPYVHPPIDVGADKLLPHALPAGHNEVRATSADPSYRGRPYVEIVPVIDRGAATCGTVIEVVVPRDAFPATDEPSFLQNTLFYGGDLCEDCWPPATADATACYVLCFDKPDCVAFTWIRPEKTGTGQSACKLKRAIVEQLDSDCCISGVLRER